MKYNGFLKAIACICGGEEYPDVRGVVKFFQCCSGTILEAEVTGLPETDPGFFAIHIHDGESCAGAGFGDSGSHFNPGGTMHPGHAGDLPPLLADHGRAYMKVFTDRFHVEEVIGKTVIIHGGPDDFHTQPSGNAGTKIACGLIHPVQKGRLS